VDYDEVRSVVANCRFTDHARREMESEPFGLIRVDEVLQALDAGEIIEEYPEDKPYSSCLILGRTLAGRPIHVVCAPVSTDRRLIVITTYQPDPERWEADFKQRKRL